MKMQDLKRGDWFTTDGGGLMIKISDFGSFNAINLMTGNEWTIARCEEVKKEQDLKLSVLFKPAQSPL